jgi:hypothetical protein
VFQLAAALGAPVFTHVREAIMAVQQVISDAILTGASLHIDISIATWGYQPRNRNGTGSAKQDSTSRRTISLSCCVHRLQTALFDEDGTKLGVTMNLQWVATENAYKETLKAIEKPAVLLLSIHETKWIKAGIASKGTIIASDGMLMPNSHIQEHRTFSRVLVSM